MTECMRCGQCCNPVGIGFTKAYMRTHLSFDPKDRNWVLYKLRRISHARAQELNPAICDDDRRKFYTCKNYNEATHLCMAYDKRPPCCEDFPGKSLTVQGLQPFTKCSYWHDISMEEWPFNVQPLTVMWEQ